MTLYDFTIQLFEDIRLGALATINGFEELNNKKIGTDNFFPITISHKIFTKRFTPSQLAAYRNAKRTAEIDEYPIKGLISTQTRLYLGQLMNCINEPTEEPPVVAVYKGRKFIVDGHHRIAAKILFGLNRVSVRVVDIAKILEC